MSDNFIVNDGDGAKLVPVEAKDYSNDPKLTDEKFKERAEHEAETTKDVVGPMAISPELLAKTKKKIGRPKKVPGAAPVEEKQEKPKYWYCSTCRENIDDKNVMKIGAGTNRWAVFCCQCQRSFGFQDQDLHDKVAKLIRDNPTGK
jgi:hypothetical protein